MPFPPEEPRNSGVRQLLASEPCLYTLHRETDGTHVLETEVNRSASYSIRFKLNDAELAQYAQEGDAFLRTLALRVDSFPDSFRERAL